MAVAHFAGSPFVLQRSWGSAPLHPRLYALAALRGLNANSLEIVDQLRERSGVQGIILGGTELPLILRDAEHNGVHFLDTTSIHVKRIVAELLA